ncbi:MAG TPA: transglycosylase SLT domain-containing protein [Thermoanaerobaculia bacterium]
MKRFALALFALFLALPLSARTLATNAFPAPMPQYLAEIITDAAAQYHVDPNLIAAMAYKESRFNPNAVSWRGAQGILQLMPRTAKSLGVTDAFDPKQNVFGAAKYIKYLLDRFHGDIEMAVAAYNAGPERVTKEGPRATAEAIDYVAVVTSLYRGALRTL